jgi:hypothetical protein
VPWRSPAGCAARFGRYRPTVTEAEQTPPHPAVLDDMKPYVGAVGAVALLGVPAEIGVPIVRRSRRQSGVSAAPGLMNLVNGILALAVVRYLRLRPAQWQRWKHQRIPRWAGIASLLYLALSPVAATRSKRAVIFPGRSPLWGVLVSPIGTLQIALTLGALYRARKAKSAGMTGAEAHADTDDGANSS